MYKALLVSDAIVNVGIPVAGRTAFIGRAVEGVLAQTLDRWRLTIVEDGVESAGVRAAVAPYLSDPRITYAAMGSGVGAPLVKTTLAKRGDAPFVALLDDDDVWQPEFLARHVAFMESHPDVGFVFCANTVIDEAGRETGRSQQVLTEGVHNSGQMVLRLLEHNLVASPTILIRRSAFEAVGGEFDQRLQTSYDLDMWLRLAARFPVGYRASWDACYRQHANQSTVIDRSLRSAELLLLYDNAEAASATSPERATAAQIIRRRRAFVLLSAALDRVEAGERKRAWKALKDAVRVSPRVLRDVRVPVVVLAICVPGSARGLRAARIFTLRHGLRGGRLESRWRRRRRR
jgi:hypothetical protein